MTFFSPQNRFHPRSGLSCEDSSLSPEQWKKPGSFEVLTTDPSSPARAGRLWTAHGPIDTPCFMAVGTYGAVKGLDRNDLEAVGAQIILGNAYHLSHRPGAQQIHQFGGLHAWMKWNRPILTDSGGYQVFSLRSLQRIDDEGVSYRTHFDGSAQRMTPRSVLEVQAQLNSDICMILDHCLPGMADESQLRDAMARTTRWAEAAAAMRTEILAEHQLCFGILQGGTNLQLRRQHLAELTSLPFDGFAIGGLSVGEPITLMHETLAAMGPELPSERPRYVMGIGTPLDLLLAVRSGIDMFDCVMPTRHARNGQLFTFFGRMNIRRAQYRNDPNPVDENCFCPCCQNYSRAYLRHLHEHNDPLYGRLATLHNLSFFYEWVGMLRRALHTRDFASVVRELGQMPICGANPQQDEDAAS